MKYWFFDGSDVIGPFAANELAANKSFSATSLICPEDFSDDGDHWQPAALFAELKTFLAKNAAQANETAASLEEELDTLLKERSPLAFDETPTDSPALEIPKKPSKPGPIEDYFNKIKKEDLGDILGIPDPNDDSDMDLAHALAKQLEKTASTRRKQQETSEPAVPAPDPLEQTHHVATATEVFGTSSPVDDAQLTMPTLPPSTLPTLATDEEKSPETSATPEPDLHPLDQQPQPNTSVEGTPQPAENIPTAAENTSATDSSSNAKETEAPGIIPDPALLRAEKIEVNSVRARLKQTQEMKDFLSETQNSHLKRQYRAQRKILVILLAALAIMIALVIALQFKKHPQTTPATPVTAPTNAAAYTHELLKETPDVVPPAPAVVPSAHDTQEQKALAIVQNYQLSANRGTLLSYLNHIYKTQLSQGYTAVWEAEPLHQSTYIVKYRLTKTRKEPIIYIFQADVALNKLTGALNNISLDLVGKI